MSDRVLEVLFFFAATGIVGAGIYALLDHAAPILATTPEQTPPPISAPAPRVVTSPPVTVAPPSEAAIFRCETGGSIVYSDAPCKGGKPVDIQIPRGYEAPRAAMRSAPVVVAQAREAAPTTTSSTEVARATECNYLDEAIKQIDAAARVGGTIPYMEELKERRRKLVDRKYELRC